MHLDLDNEVFDNHEGRMGIASLDLVQLGSFDL